MQICWEESVCLTCSPGREKTCKRWVTWEGMCRLELGLSPALRCAIDVLVSLNQSLSAHQSISQLHLPRQPNSIFKHMMMRIATRCCQMFVFRRTCYVFASLYTHSGQSGCKMPPDQWFPPALCCCKWVPRKAGLKSFLLLQKWQT